MQKRTKASDSAIEATISAMDSLPVVARLEFVKNLIFDRGGSKDSAPQDPGLVIASEVLRGVIGVLRKHPQSDGSKNIL
jgi:hypothetical protein